MSATPAWVISPFKTFVTNTGSPILPGSQNKTQQSITSLPACNSNDSLHVKWLTWELQWQSHRSAGQEKWISLLYYYWSAGNLSVHKDTQKNSYLKQHPQDERPALYQSAGWFLRFYHKIRLHHSGGIWILNNRKYISASEYKQLNHFIEIYNVHKLDNTEYNHFIIIFTFTILSSTIREFVTVREKKNDLRHLWLEIGNTD